MQSRPAGSNRHARMPALLALVALPIAAVSTACAEANTLDGTSSSSPNDGEAEDDQGGPAGPDLGDDGPGDAPPREGPPPPIPDADHYVLRRGHVVGRGVADLEIENGRIRALGDPTLQRPGLPAVDLDGYYLAPAFIDSHVHLRYWDVSAELGAGGITAAVDLGAPVDALADPYPELVTVLQSGPMITAPGGYPLDSWGADGYGIPTATPAEARANVAFLDAAGAALIKIPLQGGPELDDATFVAAVNEAHARGMPVAVHALDAEAVRRAGTLGADLLAHAPLQALDADTAALWSGKAVVPTLDALGPSETAFDAVASLRAAGAQVLYGTDLGNARTPAISARELDWMSALGMSPAEILDAGTRAPAQFWGLDELGVIEPGAWASLLVLRRDPLLDEDTLAEPAAVIIAGEVR